MCFIIFNRIIRLLFKNRKISNNTLISLLFLDFFFFFFVSLKLITEMELSFNFHNFYSITKIINGRN